MQNAITKMLVDVVLAPLAETERSVRLLFANALLPGKAPWIAHLLLEQAARMARSCIQDREIAHLLLRRKNDDTYDMDIARLDALAREIERHLRIHELTNGKGAA